MVLFPLKITELQSTDFRGLIFRGSYFGTLQFCDFGFAAML